MAAIELLSECKRDILVGESTKAVEKMAILCKKIADEHGELHESLAEPYYVYGCALLEVARMESCVLGNALDGIAGDLNDDSAGEIIEPSTDTVLMVKSQELDSEPNAHVVIDALEIEKNAGDVNDGNVENQDDSSNCSEDAVTNLQLAWEMFELSKKLFI